MKRLVLIIVILSLALNGCEGSVTIEPPLTTSSAPSTNTPVLPTATITPIPEGKTIVVTSAEDSGPGTLRQALLDAQPYDTITFAPAIFPPDKPTTIFLENLVDRDNALSINQGRLTIDASNAGVILDGSKMEGDWVNGLSISSDGNTIRGLQIIHFSGVGLVLCSASGNMIGGDPEIGAGPIGQGNLSSKNGIGIDLCDRGENNIFQGNLIGTDFTATEKWGNNTDGVWIENGITHTLVGPGNVIAFNGTDGVRITGTNTDGNTITQNSIHHNGNDGIKLQRDDLLKLLPYVVSVDLAKGTVAGTTCPNCKIEFYSDECDQGAIYEGATEADQNGVFTFDKSSSFIGPGFSTLIIDNHGNTSEFSNAIVTMLQEGNISPGTPINIKPSGELEDNRIGVIFADLYHPEKYGEVFPNSVLETDTILKLGYKRVRLSVNNDIDSSRIDWTTPELAVDPKHDQYIDTLVENGVQVTLVLTFWDKEFVAAGGELGKPRFQDEGEIQRYLDFVRFTVSHFKDRVEYYEIWNEPDVFDPVTNPVQWIKAEDYIDLVRRTVPVIREEYPGAKILVGGTSFMIFPPQQEYLFSILNSDIMPLVDGVAWHPFYGTSPQYDFHRQYYYDYPNLVQKIKDAASSHGFQGEYFADEITWRTPETAVADQPWPNVYSEEGVAKYLARGIVMHLGMDVAVTQNGHDPDSFGYLIRNLCASLAGARVSDLPVAVQSDADYIKSYGFILLSGERLLAIWNDGVAVDNDPGTPATVAVPGFAGWHVTGIDVIQGFEQELISTDENGDLVIRDFLLKDYPILIRLAPY